MLTYNNVVQYMPVEGSPVLPGCLVNVPQLEHCLGDVVFVFRE